LEIECDYTRDLKKRGPTKGLSDANNLALAFLCVEVPGCVEALAKILQYENKILASVRKALDTDLINAETRKLAPPFAAMERAARSSPTHGRGIPSAKPSLML
jgi:hypothetical protein